MAVRNGNASKQSAFGTACGPVAQLDRVFDYESKGRGFESRQVHYFSLINFLKGHDYELYCYGS